MKLPAPLKLHDYAERLFMSVRTPSPTCKECGKTLQTSLYDLCGPCHAELKGPFELERDDDE